MLLLYDIRYSKNPRILNDTNIQKESTMNQIISEAKAEFIRAKERISKALMTTPNEKINWSPAPSARTPIELVVHAGIGNTIIGNMILGKPFPYGSMAEMDAASKTEEKKYSTREEALGILEKTSSEYLALLDSLTDEQLKSTVIFGASSFPMASAITFPADHIRSHASQIDYIQTVYGDNEFHM